MDLSSWVEQIQFCQHDPDALDLGAIEDALDHLDELVDQTFHDFGSPKAGVDEPARQTLLTMAEVLSAFCQNLDSFLAELDFAWLASAWRQAKTLAELRCDLTSQSRLVGHGVF